jgi:hypothetical protein
MERVSIIVSVVGAIASIIAAIAGVVTYKFTKKMSRGNIRRQIAIKERQISEIETELIRKFGIYDTGRGRAKTALDRKIEKLQADIEDLRLEL